MRTRQERADDTRRRLFEAAVHCFSTTGYEAARIDDIARRAGVAKGTFFVHFATKDAVIVELVRIQTRVALGARVDDPVRSLAGTVRALAQQAGLSRELTRAVLSATLANRAIAGEADALFADVLAAMIADARRARLRRGRSPEQVARGLLAVYLGAAYHFASNPDSEPLPKLVAPLADAVLEGCLEDSNAAPNRRVVRRARRLQLRQSARQRASARRRGTRQQPGARDV